MWQKSTLPFPPNSYMSPNHRLIWSMRVTRMPPSLNRPIGRVNKFVTMPPVVGRLRPVTIVFIWTHWDVWPMRHSVNPYCHSRKKKRYTKTKKTNKTREYKKEKLLSDGMNLALEKWSIHLYKIYNINSSLIQNIFMFVWWMYGMSWKQIYSRYSSEK